MKTRIMLAFLSLLLISSKAKAEDDDVVVRLPPELDMPAPKPLSPQESVRKEIRERVNKKLPYNNDPSNSLGTLGQLVKLCDFIFIGKVTDIAGTQEGESWAKEAYQGKGRITLSVETNLFGYTQDKHVIVRLDWWETWRHPKVGDRMLVFLARERYDKFVFDVMRFDFDKAQFKGETNDTPIVVRECRGMISLDNEQAGKSFVAATDGYLQVLRREQPRDATKYYNLLRQLVLSPVRRVRDDARSDLLKFLRSYPAFDLNRVLEDKNVDDGIKEYVRLILLPSRQPTKVP